MLNLEVLKGSNEGTVYRLGTGVLTIGRDHRNQIQVVDTGVSRRHAMIRWTGSVYLRVDLKSRNGLKVNGEKVGQTELGEGDRIQIGDTELEVVQDDRSQEDQVLAAKDANDVAVAATTMQPQVPASVTAPVVDVETPTQVYAARLVKLAASLRQATRNGTPAAEVHEQAVEGVLDLLGADRAIVLDATGPGTPVVSVIGVAPEVSEARRDVDAHLGTVDAVLAQRLPLYDDTPMGTSGPDALGAVAAAPIVENDRLVGLLYVDSFADSDHSFVQGDLELLRAVSEALAASF